MEIKELAPKEYLGTGKIAKIFNVAPRTVAKWIDTDLLHGTRIPGSKHRRVLLDEVIRFAGEHGVPVPDWLVCKGPISKLPAEQCRLEQGGPNHLGIPGVSQTELDHLIGRVEV